jgi:hypothetical protein
LKVAFIGPQMHIINPLIISFPFNNIGINDIIVRARNTIFPLTNNWEFRKDQSLTCLVTPPSKYIYVHIT